MHMVKKLFGASFEESNKIAYNLFKEKNGMIQEQKVVRI